MELTKRITRKGKRKNRLSGDGKQRRTASEKTVARLSLYRRLLYALKEEGVENTYSHKLAEMAENSPAQVRRDIMALGYSGSPTRGYDVSELIESIGSFLDAPQGQHIALVGTGHLGQAILTYFTGRRPKLSIVAAFDTDPEKSGHVIHGCPCHDIRDLEKIVKEQEIDVAILTVPASEAQQTAELLCEAGVRGLLNFTPARLHLADNIFVENYDIAMCLEKVAYFARQGGKPPRDDEDDQ